MRGFLIITQFSMANITNFYVLPSLMVMRAFLRVRQRHFLDLISGQLYFFHLHFFYCPRLNRAPHSCAARPLSDFFSPLPPPPPSLLTGAMAFSAFFPLSAHYPSSLRPLPSPLRCQYYPKLTTTSRRRSVATCRSLLGCAHQETLKTFI